MTDAPDQETQTRLARLRKMVVDARNVPMSASCMLNRSEVLALIDEIVAGLPQELEKSKTLITEQFAAHAQARQHADEVIERARQEARKIASMSEVARLADDHAVSVRSAAADDARQIKIEADAYIDSRLADFEASLQRTVGQIATMRQRLAARSHLDDSSVEALPKLD